MAIRIAQRLPRARDGSGPPLDIPVASIYVVVAALNICGMVVMAPPPPTAPAAACDGRPGACRAWR